VNDSQLPASKADPARPWRAYAPGPLSYLAAVVVAALALVGTSLPGDLLIDVMAFVTIATLCAALVVLAIVDRRSASRRRTAAGWLAMAAVGVLCLAMIALGVPVATRFAASRSALDRAAARSEAGEAVGGGWIGFMPVRSVRSVVDGTTIFVVNSVGPSLGQKCGLAHNSHHALEDTDGALRQIAEGWWTWCDYASD
jgi:hypothetical protein